MVDVAAIIDLGGWLANVTVPDTKKFGAGEPGAVHAITVDVVVGDACTVYVAVKLAKLSVQIASQNVFTHPGWNVLRGSCVLKRAFFALILINMPAP